MGSVRFGLSPNEQSGPRRERRGHRELRAGKLAAECVSVLGPLWRWVRGLSFQLADACRERFDICWGSTRLAGPVLSSLRHEGFMARQPDTRVVLYPNESAVHPRHAPDKAAKPWVSDPAHQHHNHLVRTKMPCCRASGIITSERSKQKRPVARAGTVPGTVPLAHRFSFAKLRASLILLFPLALAFDSSPETPSAAASTSATARSRQN